MNTTMDKLNNMAAEIEAMKVQLQISGDPSNTQFRTIGDIKRTRASEEFLKENLENWKDIGEQYYKWRTENHISKAEVSRHLGISTATLTKFEDGKPVLRAQAIERAYDMFIEKMQLEKHLDRLYALYGRYGNDETIWDFEQYVNAVILDIETLVERKRPFGATVENLNKLSEAIKKYKEYLEIKGQPLEFDDFIGLPIKSFIYN